MDGGFAREFITVPSIGNESQKIIPTDSLPRFKLQENQIEWQGKPISTVVLGQDNDNTMVMNSSYPLSALIANPSTISGHGDQLVFTLQLPSTNNVIETNDESKSDYNQPISILTGGKVANTPIHQFTNGGNVQLNMQGICSIPQVTSIGVPGVQIFNSQLNGNANVTHGQQQLNTLTQTANMAPITIQQLPQPMGLAQIVITGGQLIQGVQGGQLILPSSAGLPSSPQIITLPINQLTPGQQIFAGANGQIISTSYNNAQTLTSPSPSTTVNNIQPSTIFANNLPVQGLNLNQSFQPIFTGTNGQIIAISPQQVMGQYPNIVQVYGSTSPSNADKIYQPIQTSESQVIASGKGNISCSNQQTNIPIQPLVQLATSSDSIQIQSQTFQKSATTETVQQASSPSITSTESSTPISQTRANTVDGINLEEIKEFAKLFKIRRLSLGLTQTQVGQALNVAEGPAYSQSAICRFEKLDITPKSAQKIKPVLERWMKEAEERYKNGAMHLTDFIGTEPSKKRKRRTSFTPQALDILNRHFDNNTHPSGTEMTDLADKLNYDREVVRVWFCNKRQTLKNTGKKVKSEFV